MGRSSESHRRSVNEPNGQTYSSADGVAALPRRRRFADPYVYRSLSTHPSSPGAPSSLDRRLRITNDFPGTRATRKSLAMRKFYHNFSRLRLYFWTERYLRSATSQDTLGFRFRSNNRRKKILTFDIVWRSVWIVWNALTEDINAISDYPTQISEDFPSLWCVYKPGHIVSVKPT